MVHTHYRKVFKQALFQFITGPDPFLAMLKCVMTEMMRIEAEAKVGAIKGTHTKERRTYFSGARARRVDTRLGAVSLLVPMKQIWLQPDKKSAKRAASALIDDYEKRFPEAVRCLEEGLEDSLSF